ncbi:MAG: sugar phosphate nucleotidyltransferase, partial [Polyangiales bacterium]
VANEKAFAETVQRALEVAKVRDLATIGISPSRPDTGFGYIEMGAEISKGAFDVARFVEKPNLARAQEYVASGRYLWNGGMFFFRAAAMERAIRALMPELAKGLDAMGEANVASVFPTLPSISVDYGIVEKLEPARIGVVAGDFGWSDVGSWESAWELASKDEHGNALPSDAISVDARGNLVRAKKMVALVGVDDLVVVETDDAILVMPRKRAQDVRAVVDALKAKGKNELL